MPDVTLNVELNDDVKDFSNNSDVGIFAFSLHLAFS